MLERALEKEVSWKIGRLDWNWGLYTVGIGRLGFISSWDWEIGIWEQLGLDDGDL